ncbi:MAG: YGGT family protein [Firmicutes bacterium ADurb.Bin419]|nr:MAG: YGGT family protein [Firmicutes bacterium ADurb.Bin419]
MYTLIRALDLLLYVIEIALVIRAVLSWIPNISRDNPLIVILNQVTEPILTPVRAMVEKSSFGRNSMIDISPLIVFLIIEVVRRVLMGLL